MSDLYLIVRDADGLAINAIRWDGTDPYDPGEGMTLYPWDESARPWVGWTRNSDGTWVAPPDPQSIDGEGI